MTYIAVARKGKIEVVDMAWYIANSHRCIYIRESNSKESLEEWAASLAEKPYQSAQSEIKPRSL